MASQQVLATSLLYAFGLKQPATGWSLFYLYAMLILDFLLTLLRIPLLLMMLRDWFRYKSSIKATFFAFLGTWMLVDLPRLFLYIGPVLFNAANSAKMITLLLVATYYDIYHVYAKSIGLVAFAWNRLAIFGFGQNPAFNSNRSGPTCFLLVLMPLLPTVITATVPPAYSPAQIFCYVCIGISDIFLVCSVFARLYNRYRFSLENSMLEYRIYLFPVILHILMLLCMLLQHHVISPNDWAKSDTEAVVYSGIQLTFTLFMYHIPLLVLLLLSPQLRQALMKNPFVFELPQKLQ